MSENEHPAYQLITLETVDRAIYDWFDKTLDAHVNDPSGPRKKVRVNMAAGERWITSRQKRGFRDSNGVLILPIISLRRTTVDPDLTASTLGTETGTIQIAKEINPKTNDLANLSFLREPARRLLRPRVYDVYTIPFPDRVVLNYELQIQAQYITQMNTIIEKMIHQMDIGKNFVAPLENDGRHPPLGVELEDRKKIGQRYVVGMFETDVRDSGNFEEFTDQERIVRFSTSFRVPAVLQLDPEGEKPALQVERTAFKVEFPDEKVCFVDDPELIIKIFGKS